MAIAATIPTLEEVQQALEAVKAFFGPGRHVSLYPTVNISRLGALVEVAIRGPVYGHVKLADSGHLCFIRLPDSRRFDADEFNRYVERRLQQEP